jgi:DNA-binding response OmpR family regulator
MSLSPIILLLEDDMVQAMSLEAIMEDAGYVVSGPFSTCASALARLEEQTPNLALLDTTLPDGSSMGVAAELTRRGVPFLILSGHRGDKNTIPAFMNVAWVDKPVSNHTLLTALESLLAPVGPSEEPPVGKTPYDALSA